MLHFWSSFGSDAAVICELLEAPVLKSAKTFCRSVAVLKPINKNHMEPTSALEWPSLLHPSSGRMTSSYHESCYNYILTCEFSAAAVRPERLCTGHHFHAWTAALLNVASWQQQSLSRYLAAFSHLVSLIPSELFSRQFLCNPCITLLSKCCTLAVTAQFTDPKLFVVVCTIETSSVTVQWNSFLYYQCHCTSCS